MLNAFVYNIQRRFFVLINMKFFTPILILFLSSCGNAMITKLVPLSIDKTIGEQAEQTVGMQFGDIEVLDSLKYKKAYAKLNQIKTDILNSDKINYKYDFDWQLTIIKDDKTLNAFCLPGGKIYVFTGLIKYLDSEDALAGVIGHEIAHADCRHGTAQLLKNAGLGLVLQFIFGMDDGGLVNLGANLLSLQFSRADEEEADKKSVEYLYQTNYDPRGAAKFFEKMLLEKKDPKMYELLSTHPDSEKRVAEINAYWQALGSKKGKSYTKEYQQLKKMLP